MNLPPINKNSIEKEIIASALRNLEEDVKGKLEESHEEAEDYKDSYSNAKKWKDLEDSDDVSPKSKPKRDISPVSKIKTRKYGFVNTLQFVKIVTIFTSF